MGFIRGIASFIAFICTLCLVIGAVDWVIGGVNPDGHWPAPFGGNDFGAYMWQNALMAVGAWVVVVFTSVAIEARDYPLN